MPPTTKSHSILHPWTGQLVKLRHLFSQKGLLVTLGHLLTKPEWLPLVSLVIVAGDFCLSGLVIYSVKYTEIDFSTYMEQVEMFLNGSRDYLDIKGATGPLVYPAGHLYVYWVIHALTGAGSKVILGQLLFMLIYLINLVVMLTIYCKLSHLPPYVVMMAIFSSYRVHSIFILRLFNDAIAMTVFHISLLLFLSNKWHSGSVIYSLAVGIKMNVLLFAPGLLVLLLELLPFGQVIVCLSLCAGIQLLIGLPFLLNAPWRYLVGAFDLSRVFLYKWTVNWRFLPEWIFLNRWFHCLLLLLHVTLLIVFLYPRVVQLVKRKMRPLDLVDDKATIGKTLFTVNLIGLACSRSLHYQFYVWYFYSIPALLWYTRYPTVARLTMMAVLEWSWNTYPSTRLSSSLLVLVNFLILLGLYFGDRGEGRKKRAKLE